MKIWYSGIPKNYGTLDTAHPAWLPILVSYYHLRNKMEYPTVASELFLDSGAFSARSSGKTLDVDEYCKYVHERAGMFTTVAALDVIGDPAKSWDNYLAMLSNGVNPLPAFHIGSDLKWLKLYTEKTNYIALGGIAKVRDKARYQFLNQVFSAYPDSNEIGFHGFGVTTVSIMKVFPWKTVDSSRAVITAYSGGIITALGEFTLTNNSTANLPPMIIAQLKEHCEGLGLDWQLMCTPTLPGTIQRFRCTVDYFESIKDDHPEIYTPHMVGFL